MEGGRHRCLRIIEKRDAGEAGEDLWLLDEIARRGAQRMLMAALKTEADSYVDRHRDEPSRRPPCSDDHTEASSLNLVVV